LSIDTAQKRSSVWEVPGVQLNPFPTGSVDIRDRQEMSDVYCGIGAVAFYLPSTTCWNNGYRSSSVWHLGLKATLTWTKPRSNLSGWGKSGAGSASWSASGSPTKDWNNEKEVTPC
jgi:hypothetical protein